ncbi:MAG: sensor domain-containing diguanylate cyclase [Clostridia bacterium]|nr:sensor domain-containing diguanylate cyclase [Clostridia bacterium]
MPSKSIYQYILNGVKDGVYFVDKSRQITFWNKAAEIITGFSSSEVLGHHCYDNILNHVDSSGTELCKAGCPLHQSLTDGEIRDTLVYLHHKDGHRVPVAVHIMPIYEHDEIIGAVETFTDESSQTAFLKDLDELKIIAYQDQLTGLPNRRYLDNSLENQLATFRELGIPFGVAMFDIDKFKNFNDNYGHDIGDEVLKMVAKVFRAMTRSGDIIGRWGGEEFLGIFANVTESQLDMILNRIRVLTEKSSINHNDERLQVTISIGGAIINDEDTASNLIKKADENLYISKENGRNQVTVK